MRNKEKDTVKNMRNAFLMFKQELSCELGISEDDVNLFKHQKKREKISSKMAKREKKRMKNKK